MANANENDFILEFNDGLEAMLSDAEAWGEDGYYRPTEGRGGEPNNSPLVVEAPQPKAALDDLVSDEKLPENDGQKVTKKGQRPSENRKKRSASNARPIRDTMLSMKVENTGHICKKDFSHFKQTYFPEKAPLPYPRLNPLLKLLVCQYVMHTQEDGALSVPFVFRLPTNLHGMDSSGLNKKIYRKIKGSLKRKPLFWTTEEHDGNRPGRGEVITHINGEILLHSENELKKLRLAFRDINDAPKSLDFPISSRNKEINKHGEFYAIYNWPGYASKQGFERHYKVLTARYTGETYQPEDRRFFYISRELTKMASRFYSDHIEAGSFSKSVA